MQKRIPSPKLQMVVGIAVDIETVGALYLCCSPR
jgi:hypothetical protein